MKNYSTYYLILVLVFTLSVPVVAQSGLEGPTVTGKRAKEGMKEERRKERQKQKEVKAVKQYNKEKAEEENVTPRYKGIFRKRKKEAKKSRSQPQASQ